MGKYVRIASLPIIIMIILGTMPLIFSDSSEEYYMLDLINRERQAQGLQPLTMNSALSSAARSHSQDMINRNFFNHVNPDGLTPSDRARNSGYNFIALAENICGNPSVDAGHSSLMGSPSHRVNILNSSYKEVGIGIVDGGTYGKMITQLFGTQTGNNVTTPTTPLQETQGKPDLMIQGIDFSGQSEPLKQITMKINIINSGNKNAGSFVFAVFEGLPEKGNQLGKVNISSLYAGQKITADFSWTPPAEGTYTLYFVVDNDNNIAEENENNNVATYNVIVKNPNSASPSHNITNTTPSTNTQNTKPDLYISANDISYNQMIYEGTSSLLSFRISNIGKSSAFRIPVKVYVNGELKASSTIIQILPSSYTDLNLYMTFTNHGDNVIDLKIDPENTIDEISKLNNNINFNIRVLQRESNSIPTQNTNQNPKLNSKYIDLLIYPYYITTEEDENGFISVKAKIKNRGNVKVDDFSVSYYKRDTNSSNDIFLERHYISLGPEEIVEQEILFMPNELFGEVIVVIDEEEKIKETDKNNNIAKKIFYKSTTELDIPTDSIINTTPEDVNISDSFKVTMKLEDINASNVYLYYKYEDTNNSFIILTMNDEGENSFSIEIDPLGRNNISYYFEVDTGDNLIVSPFNSPDNLYSTNINYQIKSRDKNNPSFLDNLRKIFRLV